MNISILYLCVYYDLYDFDRLLTHPINQTDDTSSFFVLACRIPPNSTDAPTPRPTLSVAWSSLFHMPLMIVWQKQQQQREGMNRRGGFRANENIIQCNIARLIKTIYRNQKPENKTQTFSNIFHLRPTITLPYAYYYYSENKSLYTIAVLWPFKN